MSHAPGTPTPQILVIGRDGAVRDAVFAAAAALQLRPTAADVAAAPGWWRRAGTVFVGAESAPALAELGLARRPDVFVVGSDPHEAGRWSMPLGAEVILLPEGRAWLSSILSRGGSASRAPVVAVVGGSGGIGASTLAATLAGRAARRGRTSALVDVDPLGGGIDLLLGAERIAGWRWPRLSGAEGFLGDLRPHLPVVEGVALLSMARGPALDVAREPLAAVLGSLQRTFDLVVTDCGRGQGVAARDCLRSASRVLLVVGSSLRSVAAARQVVDALELVHAEIVVRRQPGGTVPDDIVADAVGLAILAAVPEEPALRSAAEAGDQPGLRGGRRGYARACERLLADLLPDEVAA